MNQLIVASFPGCDLKKVESAAEASLLSTSRLIAVGNALQATKHLQGDTAEIGTAGGGTSELIALTNGGARHWACDTFEGLVDVGEKDEVLTNGMFRRSANSARERLREYKTIRVVQGYFPDSAPPMMARATYRFAHIDVDTYQSTKNCFEFFAGRMVSGGMIALDDVLPERSGCPGAQKAWLEIANSKGAKSWRKFSETSPQIIIQFN